jgi:acetate kinase
VFTAGIGENAPDIRRRICARLQYLGVELDEKRNAVAGRKVDISAPGTPVRVLVVATDEERMIARETRALVEGL